MRKFLISLLLASACALTVAAVGCKDKSDESSSPDSSSTPPAAIAATLDLIQGEGYSYIDFKLNGAAADIKKAALKVNDEVSFSVDLGAFYTGYPVVLVNGEPIAASNGVYTAKLTEETTIKVNGVEKDRSNMSGTGAFDNPFLVSRPIDLIYIAEQVNKGVSTYVNGAYVLTNDIDCKGEELEIIGNYRIPSAYFAGCFSSRTAEASEDDLGGIVGMADEEDETPVEAPRYTISNFVINSDDSNYVGLFGAVMVDLTVNSSGLFYGINLADFEINASLNDPADPANMTMTCGGLIGYGIGARTYVCDATDGEINVYGDDAYFAYAGGLVGYLQSLYVAEYDALYISEIAYSTVDVDVNVLRGAALCAGGVAGYLTTNYALCPALVHNVAAYGNVSGAFRCGGIVGGLGQYSSVATAYAAGKISAKSTQTLEETVKGAEEYLYAYAGGLVGFADNDTIVNDSFFAGKTSAKATADEYEIANPIVGGGYDAGYLSSTSQKYIEFQCLTPDKVNLAKITELKDALGWHTLDWVFENGKYPQINYADPTADDLVATTLTVRYTTKANGVTVTIKNKTFEEMDYFDSTEGMYAPIADVFAVNGLPLYREADNGYRSYGFYLDEACTLKVPFAYLSTRNVVFYLGFADVTPVVGEYVLAVDGSANPVTLKLTADGEAIYTDGSVNQTTTYLYDGKTVIVEGARLARYYLGEIVIEDETSTDVTLTDTDFDLYRYQFYDFKGSVKDGEICLYDGVYYTEAAPLTGTATLFRGAYYKAGSTAETYEFYGKNGVDTTNGKLGFTYTVNGDEILLSYADGTKKTLNKTDLKAYDAFRGEWTKAATVNKVYTFDGIGAWSYAYLSYERVGYTYQANTLASAQGSYTVDNGTLTARNAQNEVVFTAVFNNEGYLSIIANSAEQTLYAAGSFKGVWTTGGNNAVSLRLDGIKQEGVGKATVAYQNAGETVEYVLAYEPSETAGFYVLYQEQTIYGYFHFNSATRALDAVLYNPISETENYTRYSMLLIDEFEGVWISNNDALNTMEFSGLGLYGDSKIVITSVDGTEETVTEVTYALSDFTLTGQFTYKGVVYSLRFDEDAAVVTVVAGSESTELERKDRFADTVFVDLNGNEYVFDGKGSLTRGGTFTVNGATKYGYVDNGNGYTVTGNGVTNGSITVEENHYALTLTAGETVQLFVKNDIMGTWAISNAFMLLQIGPTDTQGKVQAIYGKTESFDGYKVSMSYVDPAILYFEYVENGTGEPRNYYVYIIADGVLALSESPSLYQAEYSVCSRVDSMYGVWATADGTETVTFDGVYFPDDKKYANGVAIIRNTALKTETLYYYTVREDTILMWTQEAKGGKTLYYALQFADGGKYSKGDKAFNRVEVDSLYLTKAKDADGVTYLFDGRYTEYANGKLKTKGTVTTTLQNGTAGASYSYKILSYNANQTATLELTDKATQQVYTATLDYSDSANITIKLTASVSADQA